MTMGGRGQLGNDFGGSTKELSPRKRKNNSLLDYKLTRSEISLNCIQNDAASGGKISSSLLNLIAIPFNWRSRQLTNKSENSKDKKKPNMLMNLFKKKRVMCNKRWVSYSVQNILTVTHEKVNKRWDHVQLVWSNIRCAEKNANTSSCVWRHWHCFFAAEGKTFRNGATYLIGETQQFISNQTGFNWRFTLWGFMRLINMQENLLCVFCLPPENTNTKEIETGTTRTATRFADFSPSPNASYMIWRLRCFSHRSRCQFTVDIGALQTFNFNSS